MWTIECQTCGEQCDGEQARNLAPFMVEHSGLHPSPRFDVIYFKRICGDCGNHYRLNGDYQIHRMLREHDGAKEHDANND